MDILLFVLFAGFQLVLAGLGVYVSLKPQPPEYHRRLIVVFILLALLTIIVGVFQQERAGHEQSKLEAQLTAINNGNKQISSKIDSFIPKNEPTRVITSGSPISTVVEVTKPKGWPLAPVSASSSTRSRQVLARADSKQKLLKDHLFLLDDAPSKPGSKPLGGGLNHPPGTSAPNGSIGIITHSVIRSFVFFGYFSENSRPWRFTGIRLPMTSKGKYGFRQWSPRRWSNSNRIPNSTGKPAILTGNVPPISYETAGAAARRPRIASIQPARLGASAGGN